MPAFMVRSSPSWIAIVVLGSMMPAVRAADPPCPSQIQPTAAPGGATAQAVTIPAPRRKPSVSTPASTRLDVTSDGGVIDLGSGRLTLRGNVVVRQGDRELRANQMEVDRNNQSVRSEGRVEYNDPLLHVTGASGSYSAATGGSFQSAQFELHLQQRSVRGSARNFELTPQGALRLQGVTFTTCPVHVNSWQLKASSIVLDTHEELGTARDAAIDFQGLPLMYLPWASFPLSSERKSGFLFPSIGNTTTSGVQLAVPYYWNIAPNADFTFQPVEYSKRGPDLGGDLRFLTSDQHGELQWDYLPYDSAYGGSRSRAQLNDVLQLPAGFRLTVDAQNVSDPLYFQDFSQTPEGTSTAFLNRSADLSYRDPNWIVDAEAQQYQTIDDVTLPVTERPYARVPRVVVDSDYVYDGVLHYGFDSELVNFEHPTGSIGPNGWRTDFMPQLSLDLTGAGYFLRPAFAWRITQYQLEDTAPGEPRSPSRSLPVTSLDSGLVFERETGSRNQRELTLEPRILYLDVPYRNQSDLPVFDTAIPDLNPVELFRDNRYVGADRMSDANQLAVGVTSRLLDAQNGTQYLSATIGQAYYFETPRVTLPGETPITDPHSDFVAEIALTAFQDWNADLGVQWDPQNERSERTQLDLQYKPQGDAVVNLTYRYERFQVVPEIVEGVVQPCLLAGCDQQGFDQVDVSAAWPIRQQWSVFTREVYDLRDHEQLETFAGFEYRACCWRLRLGARRFLSTFGGTFDTGVWLQLELAGLAGVGSASDTSLTEEIRGYTPPVAEKVVGR
jgi:LPS-assembly protein